MKNPVYSFRARLVVWQALDLLSENMKSIELPVQAQFIIFL